MSALSFVFGFLAGFLAASLTVCLAVAEILYRLRRDSRPDRGDS
jgi:uncharacterized membrane protein